MSAGFTLDGRGPRRGPHYVQGCNPVDNDQCNRQAPEGALADENTVVGSQPHGPEVEGFVVE